MSKTAAEVENQELKKRLETLERSMNALKTHKELVDMVTLEDTSGSSREDPGLDPNLESDSEGKDSKCTDSDTGSGLTGSGSGLVKAG